MVSPKNHSQNLLQVLIFSILLLGTVRPSAYAQNFNTEVEAIIKIDNSNDIVEIISSARNMKDANFSLRYELSVISSDSNNNSSKNSQSGRFTLEPFEIKSVSKTSVSFNPTSKTIILLLIYNEEDKLLGTDRVVLGEQDRKEEKKMSYKSDNEGISLTGFVTENTKTKPGKDFYDFFYQLYNLNPEKTNKIIKIDEMISFGRTTKITVKVDDTTIHQFFARPKLDYLKMQAENAIKNLNRYLQYLKNRDDQITRY